MKSLARVASFAVVLVVLTDVPRAQGLTDPTRPPGAGVSVEQPGAAGSAGAAANRLQSVLISSGRRIAVIDGVPVAVGGKIGEATLVRVSEGEVLLKTGTQTEILKLLPGIDKKPARRDTREARRQP